MTDRKFIENIVEMVRELADSPTMSEINVREWLAAQLDAKRRREMGELKDGPALTALLADLGSKEAADVRQG